VVADDDDEDSEEPIDTKELPTIEHQSNEDVDNGFNIGTPYIQYYVNIPKEDQSEKPAERVVPPNSKLTTFEDIEEAEQNLLQFLTLPSTIPTRKRQKQQPLIDYTKSQIMTLESYISNMEQIATA
jgi:hypothetical protein